MCSPVNLAVTVGEMANGVFLHTVFALLADQYNIIMSYRCLSMNTSS